MGRLRKRANVPPAPVGDEIYAPKTPMIPSADIPEGFNPAMPEKPTNGITVDSDISLEPGRPRPSMPIPAGDEDLVTEQQRTARVRTQQNA